MEKKEYLNEDDFQRTKKKITRLALVVLICGILLGEGLIAAGIMKSRAVDSKTNKRTEEVVQAEIDSLNSELATLKSKLDTEFEKNDFSEEFYRLQNEISQKKRKIGKLESELWEISSGFNSTSKSIEKGKAIPFYMFGAFIILASGMISFSIYVFAKRREITAFTAQQIMQVAQEGVEKLTPTMKNTAKEIAKGITSGIEEGKKENNK